MYVVKRKSGELKDSFWIITLVACIALIAMIAFSADIHAQTTGQIQMQQESMMQFYEDTFQEEPSTIIPSGPDTVTVKGESIEIEDTSQENLIVIIPSASDAINVSATVLQNLSLSAADGQPKYTTNWPYGATLHIDESQAPVIYWTVTADY